MPRGKLVLVVFFVVASWCPVPGLRAEGTETISLPALIQEALQKNPRVLQSYHQWQAEQEKINSVRGLPDPMLSYGYFGESVQTRVGPQEQRIGISQKFPFPGKQRTQGRVQGLAAQMAQAQYQSVRRAVSKDVKLAYYDLYWLDRAREINQEEKTALGEIEAAARRRYELNRAPQQAVTRVQMEISKSLERLALIEQSRKSAVARMNRLLDRPDPTPVGPIPDLTIPRFDGQLPDLLARAKESRPEELAAELAADKARLERSLARMAYRPDFTLGYEYIDIGSGTTSSVDDGQDAWVATIAVNVPLWPGKIASSVRAKDQELQAVRRQQADTQDQIAFEVQDLYFKITTAQDILSLYETALLPQAEQAYAANQNGFETGEVSFADWLDTERTYLHTRLAYEQSRADYLKTQALLEWAVGE